MSYLGCLDGCVVEKYFLVFVVDELNKFLKKDVKFFFDCVGFEVEEVCLFLSFGLVILLENLCFYVEEEGKGVDSDGNKVKVSKEDVGKFCVFLVKLGDIYVNDVFGIVYCVYGFMVGVNLLIKVVGFFM